jgi:hypothetical protein
MQSVQDQTKGRAIKGKGWKGKMQEVRKSRTQTKAQTIVIEMSWKDIFDFFADFGDWLFKVAKKRNNAIVIVILSIFSPIGLIFVGSFVASIYRKRRK